VYRNQSILWLLIVSIEYIQITNFRLFNKNVNIKVHPCRLSKPHFRARSAIPHSLFFTASPLLSFHDRVHVPFLHSFIKSGHSWSPLTSCPLFLNCHHLISNGWIRNLHIIRIIGTAKHGTHTILYLTYFYDLGEEGGEATLYRASTGRRSGDSERDRYEHNLRRDRE